MRIIAKRTLREFWEKHADTEQPLSAWYQDCQRATWSSPQEIKQQYRNASIVNAERVVFNIKGNNYRLIVAIKYTLKIVFVKFVGTHKEYELVDAATIEL
jgi:mRNA interferase HigB